MNKTILVTLIRFGPFFLLLCSSRAWGLIFAIKCKLQFNCYKILKIKTQKKEFFFFSFFYNYFQKAESLWNVNIKQFKAIFKLNSGDRRQFNWTLEMESRMKIAGKLRENGNFKVPMFPSSKRISLFATINLRLQFLLIPWALDNWIPLLFSWKNLWSQLFTFLSFLYFWLVFVCRWQIASCHQLSCGSANVTHFFVFLNSFTLLN